LKGKILQHQRIFVKSLSADLGFVDFGDYFEGFLILFLGVIYEVDITPKKESKIRSKEP
jgi:hypothetical protein